MSPLKSTQRPKKRQKLGKSTFQDQAIIVDPKTNNHVPAFPLASFFWPARKATSQWVILPVIVMTVGLFKWCTGLWGYSGYQTPPMHGDYEAQRHWMEITTHLPISQWYFYDLEYWGLDYPPLTAYHSWVLGKIGSLINPAWFALYSSRGIEEQPLKVFMRATVIISEYLTYIPSAVLLNRQVSQSGGVNVWEASIALVAILLQPSTILIDHAHFQYNTVMLGFVLFSLYSIYSEHYAWACVFFVAALSYKQMALYYAPAIAFYLIGVSLSPKARPLRLTIIILTTLVSFALVLAPILLGTFYDQYRGINPPLTQTDRQVNPLLSLLTPYIDPTAHYYPYLLQLTQLVHRIFPFARGIFEDKVPNAWNLIHLAHKLNSYPIPLLQRLSTLATLIAIEPACMLISLFPHRELLPWALASCSWGFFLFSFQVHEKSVLLPLLPMTILLGGQAGLGVDMRAWVGWANLLGVWTLFPLLKRDELRIPYAVLSLLWAYLLALPPTSLSCYFGHQAANSTLRASTKAVHLGFYALMLAWHVGEAYMPPPKGKTDLWVVLNVIVGAVGFGICYLWTTWQLIVRSNVLEEWFGYRAGQQAKGEGRKARLLPLGWYGSGESDGVKDKRPAEKEKDKKAIEAPKTMNKKASLSPTPTPEPEASMRRSPRKKRAPTPM